MTAGSIAIDTVIIAIFKVLEITPFFSSNGPGGARSLIHI